MAGDEGGVGEDAGEPDLVVGGPLGDGLVRDGQGAARAGGAAQRLGDGAEQLVVGQACDGLGVGHLLPELEGALAEGDG